MFFRRKNPAKNAPGSTLAKGHFSTELLRDLSTNFGIGEQIRLRPEYIQELEVKSIVVGLLVNQRVIYANEDVTWDEGTQTLAFHCQDDGKSFSRVDDYALLLPLENSDNRKMSYQRKEELSRVGLFKRGNTITAGSDSGGHRSYAIDGVVTSYMLLKNGLFANHEVAVLNLDPESFTVSERRKHRRLLTDVPSTIKGLKGDRDFECRLIDFVEEGARFVVDDPAAPNILTIGKPVAVTVNMVELERHYRLDGTIIKVENNEVVVNFRNIHKEGAFTPFSKLDGIEIKAMLQKLPQSRIG